MQGSFRVMGIDPGLTRMGFGIVQEERGSVACLGSGTLATPPGPAAARLKELFTGLSALIHDWSPDAMAVERVFLKLNLKTGIGAIQACGIALLAGAMQGLEVAEYSPAEVKQAITGVGTAGKDQVKFMVERLLRGEVLPDTADAADALAVAITHVNSGGPLTGGGTAGRAAARR